MSAFPRVNPRVAALVFTCGKCKDVNTLYVNLSILDPELPEIHYPCEHCHSVNTLMLKQNV